MTRSTSLDSDAVPKYGVKHDSARVGKAHDDQLSGVPRKPSEQRRNLVREALDLETGRPHPDAGPGQLRKRSLQEMADFDRGGAAALRVENPQKRPRPLLANHTDLIRDTDNVLARRNVLPSENLIKTAYSERGGRRERKISDNLILDANLHFEAHLQRAIEHDEHFLQCVKDATRLIHEQLEIASLEGIELNSGELDLRAQRLAKVREMLKEYYADDALKPLLEEGKWDDKTFKQVAFKFRDDIGPPEQREDKKDFAVGLLKLYKMLETQKPYFGGSVEYMDKQQDSLEHWVYHLSSLTKDPARQYRPSDPEHGRLSKRLMDYRTGPNSLLPEMNQRNLGTGIVEAKWMELPAGLRGDIQAGMRSFGDAVGSRGDTKGAKRFATMAQLRKAVASREEQRREAEFHNGRLPDYKPDPLLEFKLDAQQIWQHANEDERKFIYGDVAQIPWSDAHLHGGHTFEQTYVPGEHAAELNFKHPETQGPGLWNVAGVKGNILELAQVAGRKYRQEMEGPKKFSEQEIQARQEEFVRKHGEWYETAMENHKPIIGGMSGHTLGYLNLYQAARDKARENGQPVSGPSTEELRAVMLAGLIGEKRHHSYDEVLAASHEMGDERDVGGPVRYRDRSGYGDVLNSRNDTIRKCAREAYEGARAEYGRILHETVLSTVLEDIDQRHRQRGLLKNDEPGNPEMAEQVEVENARRMQEVRDQRNDLTQKMAAYLDSLDKGQTEQAAAKEAIHRVIADIYAPEP